MIKAVIFDMDGTLLDSLPDLKNSVNAAMEATGYPVHTMEEVRGFVGYGIPLLIRDALPDGAPEDVYEKACRVFYDHYVQHADNETHPYPGIVDMLHQLKEQGYVLGVLSNKAEEAVISLCERFFPGLFSVEAGARDDFPRKPDPTRLRCIVEELGLRREEVIYSGDSDVDVLTAIRAGVRPVAVDWGYRSRQCLVQAGAPHIVSSPEELIQEIRTGK